MVVKIESNEVFLNHRPAGIQLERLLCSPLHCSFPSVLSPISILKEIIKSNQAGQSKQKPPRTPQLKHMPSVPTALHLALEAAFQDLNATLPTILLFNDTAN